MATTVWDRLQARAIDAVRSGLDRDIAARQLLAAAGGNRRMVLATRIRLAATAAWTPDVLEPRRALALVDRAIAVADAEGLWHPAFSEVESGQFARHHSAP
ncbi:MAG TPA: hypothetical protein VG076_16220 [Acidimicrobiales bacterium]|jgi:hypothetical protein|nr:hypothetical protein [Acidimicrobiales bacterium]